MLVIWLVLHHVYIGCDSVEPIWHILPLRIILDGILFFCARNNGVPHIENQRKISFANIALIWNYKKSLHLNDKGVPISLNKNTYRQLKP